MKAVGVYYSKTGGTLRGLQNVKEGLESVGVETRLVDVKKATCKDLEDVKIVIIGSPVHGGNAAKPVRNFLDGLPERSMEGKICSVVSSAGSGKTDGLINYLSKRLEELGAEKVLPGVGYKTWYLPPLFKGKEISEDAKKKCYELGIVLTRT